MLSALVIIAPGTNCDLELARAFELVGARPEPIHLHRLLREPNLIEHFELIGLPGGFSYGDAVAAGRIAAALMRQSLFEPLMKAVVRGTPIIAPCNGFQIAVQMGLLPGASDNDRSHRSPAPKGGVALAGNASGRFVDRWCRVEIPSNARCVWTSGLQLQAPGDMLPVAHGEGRFVVADASLIDDLESRGQVALRYAADDDPNGSMRHIAGICDASGLIFGLMPHPERFTRWMQHPTWTRFAGHDMSHDPLGLAMFRNAVAQAQQVAA